MKELSIEEKAKRYDEASKWMEGIYPTLTHEQQMEAEAFFTELKESEDEKIRKGLLKMFNHYVRNNIELNEYGLDKDMVLAWLEKQGEQKPADKVEPKFKVKYAGSEYNVFEIKELAGITFYGIEDEPNHIDYVQAENCEIISGYAIKEDGSPYPTKPAVFSEQNPAWSKEDEKRIKNIISVLDVQVCWNGATGKKENPYQKELDWLKSLKVQTNENVRYMIKKIKKE